MLMKMKRLSPSDTTKFLDDLAEALKSGQSFVSWYTTTKWAKDFSAHDNTLSEDQIRELSAVLEKTPTIGAFHAWYERALMFTDDPERLPEPFVNRLKFILAGSKDFNEIEEAYSDLGDEISDREDE